jgi:hypothetical protein
MKKIKRLLLGLLFAVALSTMVYAASPMFLICGTYPMTDPNAPTSFILTFDNGTPVTAAPVQFNGGYRPHYSVSGMAAGTHSVTVEACNQWGCSAPSSAYTFTIAVPAIPSAVGLSNQ